MSTLSREARALFLANRVVFWRLAQNWSLEVVRIRSFDKINPRFQEFAMFQFLRNLFAPQSTKPQTEKRTRLAMEALEDRLLPANYLVLDFTPDTRHGSFMSAFNLRYTDRSAPAFLDMDGDRRITTSDVTIAAREISNRVSALLNGYNIRVLYGDVLKNTGLGTSWLNWGVRQPGHQVFCMRIGGWSGQDSSNSFTTGIAPQAPYGYNNETYGNTFATSVARSLMPGGSSITARRFINEVASTTLHEFGHLVGLGHVYGHPAGGVNVMSYGTDANYGYFPNATYTVSMVDTRGNSYLAYQNPAYELALSLAGQATFATYGVNHRRVVSVAETVNADGLGGHDHMDGHDHSEEKTQAMQTIVHNVPLKKAEQVSAKPNVYVAYMHR